MLSLAGVDRCAPSIRQTIAAGLAGGAFTDAMGRLIPLSSAVVILTAPDVAVGGDDLTRLLGQDLIAACDVVAMSAADSAGAGRRGSAWIADELLAPLARRFERSGIAVTFDPSFVTWLAAQLAAANEPPDAFLDRVVTPALTASLGGARGGRGSYVAVVADGAPILRRALRE